MKRWLGEDGMTTVEVSVLVPMITLITAGVIFFFLFHLDMAVAKGEAVRIADEAAASWKTGGNLVTGEYAPSVLLDRPLLFLVKSQRKTITAQAEERLHRRLEERLSVSKVEESQVEIQNFCVKARVKLSFRFPLVSMGELMGSGAVFFCGASAPVDNWQEWLRAREGMDWK